MKKMSLLEFERFCNELQPSEFLYSSENQNNYTANSGFKMIAKYKIMFISLNPNSISFKSDDALLCLGRAKYVTVCDKYCALGTVFTVVCGDKRDNQNDISYTLIAR